MRFIFLKNNEDIPENAQKILRNLRGTFQKLVDTYSFKEALRTIYRVAQDAYQAALAFHRWRKLTDEMLVPEPKTMAMTIRDRLSGIVSYRTFRHIRNASMEGFKTKNRWPIRYAYVFGTGNTSSSKTTNSPKSTSRKHYDLLSETVEEAKKTPSFTTCEKW